MEPSEVIRRFEEAVGRLPDKQPVTIIYQMLCPISLGLSRREMGLFRKLALIERVAKVDLEEHK